MPLTFKPELRGKVALPASKSISNRALFINALCDKPCNIENLADCDDTRAMLRVVRGETVKPTPPPAKKQKATAQKRSNGMADLFAADEPQKPKEEEMAEVAEKEAQPPISRIDIGAAGTAMRFATALLAARQGEELVLCGTARMHRRPIGILVDSLRALGANIEYEGEEGFPPLRIKGQRLTGTTAELPADVSSQYVSALLMLGPVLPQGLQLRLRGDIISRPYINLTLRLMEQFGAHAMWIGDSTIFVHNGGYRRDIPLRVEGDWTAASYWYELVALSDDKNARIELTGIQRDSAQGDSLVSEFFQQLGVQTTWTKEGVVLTKQPFDNEKLLSLDLSEQPDLAQTLVVTCAMLGVPFHFTGLQSLRIKETDRIAALQTELKKLGIITQVRPNNELLWDGKAMPTDSVPAIDTYEDHRMAMAFAPCALKFPGLVINNPEVVSKSYPLFWDDLRPHLQA